MQDGKGLRCGVSGIDTRTPQCALLIQAGGAQDDQGQHRQAQCSCEPQGFHHWDFYITRFISFVWALKMKSLDM